MKTFKQHLAEAERKVICVYSGRFQPFHPGHKESYDNLVKEFGKDNVFIGTSDKVELPKSPLKFVEKKKVITTMFKDIPKDKIVQIKNPYNPKEILSQFPEDTVFVTAVGKKDGDRLGKGKYFDFYKKGSLDKNFKEGGYIFVIPRNVKVNLSGTQVRETFSKSDDKAAAFKQIYGSLDKKLAKLLGDKIK